MYKYPDFVRAQSNSKDRLYTNWGNSRGLETKARAIAANTHPDSEWQRGLVLPYRARQAPVVLVTQYTGLDKEAEGRARQWLKVNKKLPRSTPEIKSREKVFQKYELERMKRGNPGELDRLVIIGRELVANGVITENTAVWQMMHGRINIAQADTFAAGFPEYLVMEAILSSRKAGEASIEDQIRKNLRDEGLDHLFTSGLAFLDRMVATE